MFFFSAIGNITLQRISVLPTPVRFLPRFDLLLCPHVLLHLKYLLAMFVHSYDDGLYPIKRKRAFLGLCAIMAESKCASLGVCAIITEIKHRQSQIY